MRARAFLAALLLSYPTAGASAEDRPLRIHPVHGPDSAFPAVMVLARSLGAAGVILENRLSGVLEDDRGLTLGAAAVIALLAGIVVALLVNRAGRGRDLQIRADGRPRRGPGASTDRHGASRLAPRGGAFYGVDTVVVRERVGDLYVRSPGVDRRGRDSADSFAGWLTGADRGSFPRD